MVAAVVELEEARKRLVDARQYSRSPDVQRVMLRTRATLTLLCVGLAAAPGASAGSLPDVGSGARPGPEALYRPAPRAPQLENTGPWRADPILVSGAQAYRDGEWLYQDYLYDDHGAAGAPRPDGPYGAETHLYSPAAGTFLYPTDPKYAHNAADLVEMRVRRIEGGTAFRVTLNTLIDPQRTAFTIALGDSNEPRDWPHGAGVASPAELFLTARADKAELLDAGSGRAIPGAKADLDFDRRQIEVRVPDSAWSPGAGKVRMTVGVGLWDPQADAYLAPSPRSATETTPGGGGPAGAAIVNVGPRFEEPWPDVTSPVAPKTMGDAAAGGMVQAAWWRERAQADALRLGDVSAFYAEVDFAKLAAGARDDSGVPRTGFMNRILASEHEYGQGLDLEKVCFDLAGGYSAGAECIGRFVGRLQPYAIYVPDKPAPPGGYGLTLLLHSLSANYNQYANSNNMSQLGDRGAGSIVITPAGRGADGFYAGVAEADTFEVWADVARRYRLDPDWTVVSGYSMGGFGTYRLLARYPDLFARGFSVVGVPGSAMDQLASLRNTPVLTWNATADELVNVQEAEEAAEALEANGLRFTYWQFPTADHLTLATNDEYSPGAEWLGEHRVDRNPAHVTYVVDPREDSTRARTVADHAYWLSGLAVRDPETSPGLIDARSEGMGVGDPEVGEPGASAGALTGGAHGPMPYAERALDWGPAPEVARADRLHVRAQNLASATVDARRARLSCSPELVIESDGPLDLRIACTAAAVKGASCASSVALRLPRVRGQRIVAVRVSRGRRTVKLARGSDLRRVVVRRVSRKAFRVRLTLRAAGGGKPARRITVTRRVAACGR